MSGETFVGDDRARVVVPTAQDVPSLTIDQMRLLGAIADGLTAEQLARRLGVPVYPVQQRMVVLRRRMGVQTNAQLVHRAHMLGFLAPAVPGSRCVVRSEPAAWPRPRPVLVPRQGALSPKPGASADDARRIAARLEAGFKGAQR